MNKDAKFEYQGTGKIDDMPEEKRLEYEENKKRVKEIFENAMKKGVIIITAVKSDGKSESAFFINGVNPIVSMGILTMTEERIKKVITDYARSMIKDSSESKGDTSKYIG